MTTAQEQRGARIKRIWIRTLKTVIYGVIGAFLMLVAVGVYFLNSKPELKIWHTAELEEEFTVESPVSSFVEYQELEERLFAELGTEVYDRIGEEDKRAINRYHRGSLSDPERWPTNWNRSYELAPDPSAGNATVGVLLIHGLTDSPYSLRVFGERLHEQGAHVVGLRVPGHGTVPSALTRTTWQDMSAAVTLAIRHLSEQIPDRPIYVVGYSNGGALAVHYALTTMEEAGLPRLDGLVLISPEIGVSPMAGLAIWQARIGRVLGLEKLAWNSVLPEYDPFKYGSFPVNAGNLAYELTTVNREMVKRLSQSDKLKDFPSVLAFQSAFDATVSASALVRDLFVHLPANNHELVVFDINRTHEIEYLLSRDPAPEIRKVCDLADRAFVFSVLTNADPGTGDVVVRTWKPGQDAPTELATSLAWPKDLYSLSHVSLPFAAEDPLYGGDQAGESPGIRLGAAALRGEKGAIVISGNDMLRLRWNPFYSYLEGRVLGLIGASRSAE